MRGLRARGSFLLPHSLRLGARRILCYYGYLAPRRPLLALGEASAAAAARQLRKRPGDWLDSGSSGGSSRHRRRHCCRYCWGEEEEEDGEKQVLLYPEATSGSLPLTKLFRVLHSGEATAVLNMYGLVAPPE